MNIGDKYVIKEIVTPDKTAAAVGSGALEVFGTPYLVAMMENAALKYIAQELPEDKGTVGTIVSVNHTAATPMGMEVTVEVELTGISENGKMIDFSMKAWDEEGPIGDGKHQRAIITSERFLQKANAKLERASLRCPVCRQHIFEEKGGYEICPVCGWEDDPLQRKTPDMAGGANKMSLNEAREKYLAQE